MENKFRVFNKRKNEMIPWEVMKEMGTLGELLEGAEDECYSAAMPYIGLKINDKEIYKYDVLMIIAEDENGKEIGREKCVVDFDRQAFVFAPSLKHRGLTQDALFRRYKARYLRWKLLGNIYNNPELCVEREQQGPQSMVGEA